MTTIKIKPATGRRVRDEGGLLLKPGAITVPSNGYWLRKLKQQDVVEVIATPKTPTKTKAKEGKK